MELDKNHPLLEELIILQMATLKQTVQVRELLQSLIKQDEPKEQKPKPWEKFL